MNNGAYYNIELFHWSGMPNDNVDMVRDILDSNPEYLYETNKFGDNCLFIAVKVGNFKIIQYLIEEKKINCNIQNTDDDNNKMDSILMSSIRNKQKEIALYLLEQENIDFSLETYKKINVYHLLSNWADDDILEKILEKDKDFKNNINKLDSDKNSCLNYLMENYSLNKNFLYFDLLQEHINKETIETKNNLGLDIITILKRKMQESSFNNKLYSPVINILHSRL